MTLTCVQYSPPDHGVCLLGSCGVFNCLGDIWSLLCLNIQWVSPLIMLIYLHRSIHVIYMTIVLVL